MKNALKIKLMLAFGTSAAALTGCGSIAGGPELPQAPTVSVREGPGEDYMIGPLDQLTIFVWRNPELGAKVQVRPDGRITTPLITDMPAVGKTPTMLRRISSCNFRNISTTPSCR